MGSRLLLRAYILEGEQGGVGSRRSGVNIAEDVIVISLLVGTMEVILGEVILQGDQYNWNRTGKGSQENLAL